ncbi:MAG: Flp pilus assembly complex ATPase component TadA [Clostridia bacterium]|nr:Flp pilus assembly complex ATPase component TadA [Clostridia bacterium]
MNELRNILPELISRVRTALSMESYVDDMQVMEKIEDIYFSEFATGSEPYEEIKELLDICFYKIRRRLGILQPLLEDSEVTEIMVNGPDNVFIEKNGMLIRNSAVFESIRELEDVMQNIAGDVHREINELNPIVDCRLPDGSRVNGVYHNVAVNGPILTIRKFSDRHFRLENLVENGTMTEECRILLEALVEAGYNMFISGGTSSGKTTLLDALSYAVPENERVIVIEDSMELKLDSIENIVHMESKKGNQDGMGKVTMSDLIRTSLRMRPDRIIVGEVRGDEVVPMLQAMNTGHNGSLSTGHANSISGMLKRLETLYLSALPVSLDAIRLQIAEGIDFMIHVERLHGGKRTVTDISELIGYRDGEYVLNRIFEYSDGVLVRTDNLIHNTRKIRLKGKIFEDELRKDRFIR